VRGEDSGIRAEGLFCASPVSARAPAPALTAMPPSTAAPVAAVSDQKHGLRVEG